MEAARSRFLTAWVAVAAALASRMTFDDVLFQERSVSTYMCWREEQIHTTLGLLALVSTLGASLSFDDILAASAHASLGLV